MIEIKNVSFAYGEKKVLSDFSLTVNDGESVCLSGSSGCGKTTVLRLVAGLETPDSGEIVSSENISYVFQEDRLVPNLSIIKNIMLCLPKEKKEFALALLKEAGLEGVKDKKPSELSGGMKRRAAIVRAAAFGGDVLLLDEPFNGLDSDTKTKIAKMIRREFKGKTVLMVSHIKEDANLLYSKTIEMTNIG